MKKRLVFSTLCLAMYASLIIDMVAKSKLVKSIENSSLLS